MTTTPRLQRWPTSVWTTAQHPARTQRASRYVAESTAHPAKMLPAIARQVIAAYTAPDDVVLDPMCGIGTTLVEAVHLNRAAVGIEYEPRWAGVARDNLRLAEEQGAAGAGQVATGDARQLRALVDADLHGRVALVLTSPPYGASVHGQAKVSPGRGIAKSDFRYSTDADNLAHRPVGELLAAFTDILAGCAGLLRPGGVVAVTARPWRRHGTLVDLPGAVSRCAETVGLVPYERQVCLLVGLRGDRLVPRVSFFALEQVRRARRVGSPLQVIAHEDLLVYRLSRS